MTEINTATNTKKATNWTRRIAITALTLGSITAAGVGYAASNDKHGPDDAMGGPGYGHMGHMGGKGFGSDFMEFRMNKMLDRVDATDEQKQKIKAIFEKTRDTLKAERKEAKAGDNRQKMIDILKAPTIDAAAVETLRADRTARMEARSKAMTAAIVEAANVLTPEQRVKLADEMQHHGKRR